jgi:hypothetical protein
MAERHALTQTVNLNVGFASSRKLVLELAKWETHVWPGFGEDAQSVINDRLGEYDIFVGVSWNRFGTPTGRRRIRQFERAYALWKENRHPLLCYIFGARRQISHQWRKFVKSNFSWRSRIACSAWVLYSVSIQMLKNSLASCRSILFRNSPPLKSQPRFIN